MNGADDDKEVSCGINNYKSKNITDDDKKDYH